MRMKPLLARLARSSALAGMFLGGCTSSGSSREANLPFRVAVVPVKVRYLEQTPNANGAEVDDAAPRLRMDADYLSSRISEALASRIFADAVVLPQSLAPGGQLAGVDLDRYWVEQASALHASLIIECELKLVPWVNTRRNDRFWLNLVLFAVGGPATWFVADRSYLLEAHLFAGLHQVEPMLDGAASIADGQGRLANVHAQVQEVNMNLLDRAGGNLFPYLGSLVVPAAFLVPRSERALGRLAEEVAEGLADNLTKQLVGFEHHIMSGGSVSGIELAGGTRVTKRDGRVVLTGAALLRRSAASRLEGYSVTLGDARASGEFGDGAIDVAHGSGRAEFLRYAFEIPLPAVASGSSYVDLEIVGGGRDRPRRTFCIAIPTDAQVASGRPAPSSAVGAATPTVPARE